MSMNRTVLILREPEIRRLLDPASCREAVEEAFSAYATGRAALPGVIHLDLPERRGEIHVKAGHVREDPSYAVKIVSGFTGNPERGLPATDGMILVFDAETGAPAALLLDHGAITRLRTGAAPEWRSAAGSSRSTRSGKPSKGPTWWSPLRPA